MVRIKVLVIWYLCVILVKLSNSQTFTWISSDGDFNDSSCWKEASVPSASTDNVIISNGGICNIKSSDVQLDQLYLFNTSSIYVSKSIKITGLLKIEFGGYFKMNEGYFNVNEIEIFESNSVLDLNFKTGSILPNSIENQGKIIFKCSDTEPILIKNLNLYDGSSIEFLNIYKLLMDEGPVIKSGSMVYLNSSSLTITGTTFENGSLVSLDNSVVSMDTDLKTTFNIYNNSNLNLRKQNVFIESNINIGSSILKIDLGSVYSSTIKAYKDSQISGIVNFYNSSILDLGTNSTLTALNTNFYDFSSMVLLNSNISTVMDKQVFNNLSSLTITDSNIFSINNLILNDESILNALNSNISLMDKLNANDKSSILFDKVDCNIKAMVSIYKLITINSHMSILATSDCTITGLTSSNDLFSVVNSNIKAKFIMFQLNSQFLVTDSNIEMNSLTLKDSLMEFKGSSLVSNFIVDNGSNITIKNSQFNFSSIVSHNSTYRFESTYIFSLKSPIQSDSSNFEFIYTYIVAEQLEFKSSIITFSKSYVGLYPDYYYGSNLNVTDSILTFEYSNTPLVMFANITLTNVSWISSKAGITANALFLSGSSLKFIDTSLLLWSKFIISASSLEFSNTVYDNSPSGYNINVQPLSIDSLTKISFSKKVITTPSITNYGTIVFNQAPNSIAGLLFNYATVIVKHAPLTLSKDYEQFESHSLFIFPITSIEEVPVKVQGNVLFNGIQIAIVDLELLDTNDPIQFPMIQYTFVKKPVSNLLVYSLDKSNYDLETQINKICNSSFEHTTTILTLQVENCLLKKDSPRQCQGKPICGLDKGECTIYGCKCKHPWTGPDCTSKHISFTQPFKLNSNNPGTTNLIYTNTRSHEFNSGIKMIGIKELDSNDQVIENFDTLEWEIKDISTNNQTILQYISSIQKPSQSIQTSITITAEWITTPTLSNNAGETIEVPASTIIYKIDISKYPFPSYLNRLALTMSTTSQLKTNEKEICSKQEFGFLPEKYLNFNYLKVQMNSHSFFGKFSNRASLDDRNIRIENIYTPNENNSNETNVNILLTGYYQKASLNLYFSILFESQNINDKSNVNCIENESFEDIPLSKSKSKFNPLWSILIAVGGFLLLVLGVLFFRNLLNKRRMIARRQQFNLQLLANPTD